ncbi:TetR/AcrR family transcriptional regulator [Sinomonas halotolerans]|uniref:TetR family transcriptional regulator n=1 Tax=Sinomonas halotolerans TaxID=1644133 RepID=A0ABU9X3J8_9MICC
MSTRERALEAAVELLGTQGLRALTHTRVDEAAGMPRGSTSNHFRTRAALLTGVVEWLAQQDLADLGGPPSLPADVAAFVALLAHTVEATTTGSRTRTIARYVLFLEGTHNEDVRRPLLAGRAYFRAFVETSMARLGAPDPAAAATAITAVGEGMIIHRVAVDPDADVLAPLDAVVRAFLPRVRATRGPSGSGPA